MFDVFVYVFIFVLFFARVPGRFMSLICSYSTDLRLSFHYKTQQSTSRSLRDLLKLIHKCTRSYSTTTQHDIDVTRLRSDLW